MLKESREEWEGTGGGRGGGGEKEVKNKIAKKAILAGRKLHLSSFFRFIHQFILRFVPRSSLLLPHSSWNSFSNFFFLARNWKISVAKFYRLKTAQPAGVRDSRSRWSQNSVFDSFNAKRSGFLSDQIGRNKKRNLIAIWLVYLMYLMSFVANIWHWNFIRLHNRAFYRPFGFCWPTFLALFSPIATWKSET